MEYVVADVGGRLAAPVYAMFQIQEVLAARDYTAPDGSKPAAAGEDAFFWLAHRQMMRGCHGNGRESGR